MTQRRENMTFRDFVEQSLSDFEEHLRREELEPATIDLRLRGARQFALLLLGEPPRKGEATTGRLREPGHRFGGPRH
jgi:hypothetical protein